MRSFPWDIALLSVTAVCMLYALYRYAKLFFAVLRSTDPKDSIDLKSDIKAKREPKEADSRTAHAERGNP